MSFRFRLTLRHRTPGLFRFDTETTTVELEDGQVLLLSARNAETLAQATFFHFEGSNFPDEIAAKEAGEKLRIRLLVLNATLGLGIIIPLQDSTTERLASIVKDKFLEEHDLVLLDPVEGLSVFPDDSRYFEFVPSGRTYVDSSDPAYIFKALTKIWDLNITLDQPTEDALRILNLAEKETSPRAKFLITYLGLETLIQRGSRSEAAIALIESFQQQVLRANLEERERNSLRGALANLREQSFRSALLKFLDTIEHPKELNGLPIRQFFDKCVNARNKIAHKGIVDPNINFDQLSRGIKEFIILLIWTFNQIPNIAIDVPASSISVPVGGLTIKVI